MLTPAQVRGAVGFVTWSYYRAASVANFTVTRSKPHLGDCKCARCAAGRWSLRGTLVLSDSFKLSRKPLLFVVPTQKGDMVWPITDLEIKDRTVTATLGTPQ